MRNLVIALLVLVATAMVALAAQPAFAGSEPAAAEPRIEPVGDGLWQARQLLRLAPSQL